MRILKTAVFFVLGLAMVSSLNAQVGQAGAIRGQVVDAQKAPLPGVTITVTSPALMGKQSAVSGVDGTFKFPPILPPGVYTVVAELQGFSTVKRGNIVVRVATTVDVNLEMAQAAINEEVTVVAPSPVVDVVSTSINQNATTEMIATLPFPNRNVTTFAVTTAAGTRGQSIHGEASPTFTFQVDGIQFNASDQNYPEGAVDMETVQEVEFVTGGLDSTSYGGRSGFMNVVSKSGGNEFHGMAQFYYTDEKLQQIMPSDEQLQSLGLAKPTFAHYSDDMSATLGGPIFKDKLWFFGSFKYQTASNQVSFIPTTIKGKSYGSFDQVQKMPYFFGKLTWQISQNLKVFSMFTFTHSKTPHTLSLYGTGYSGGRMTVDASTVTRSIRYSSSNAITWVLNSDTILDFRGGFYTQDWSGAYAAEAVPGPFFIDSYTGYIWGNRGMQEFTYKKNLQVGLKLLRFQNNFLGGNHEFQAGFEYVRMQGEWGYWRDNPLDWTYYNESPYYYRGLYGLTGPHPLYGDGSLTFNTYGTARGNSQNVGIGYRYGGFIQDSFTIKNRLTINVGLRYDKMITDIPTQVKGAAGGSVAAAIGDYYLKPQYGFNPYQALTYEGWHNAYPYSALAPTIGISYDLTGKGKTALKLHYGTYFEAASTGTWSGLQPTSPIGFSYYWSDTNGNGQPDSPPIDNYVLQPGQNPLTMVSTTFKQQINPNLKDPYTREFTAAIEHELFPYLKVGLTYIYRDHQNITAYLNYDRASGTYWNLLSQHPEWWVPFTTTVPAYKNMPAETVTVYYRSNNAPAPFSVLTNVPQMKSLYSGLELSFDKRMQNGWALGGNFNYAYQWSNCGFPNPINFQEPGSRQFNGFADPNTQINASGRGSTVPWWLKFYGTFNVPFGFVASFIYLHTEGIYWGRTVSISAPTAWIQANNVNPGSVSCAIEANDTRLDIANDNMSFRLEKEFKLSGIGRLGLFVDIFNLFGAVYISVPVNPAGTWKPVDNNTNQGIYTSANMAPRGLSGVRSFRLSARFIF